MTLPSAFLGFLLATAAGLLFHLIRGGSLPRMALYVITAWISFFAGQLVSSLLGWQYWRLGSLNLFAALLATVLGLFASAILVGPDRRPSARADDGRRPPFDNAK